MIDSKFHVELDGNRYRIAESAEGSGYSLDEEPLRPPNAVTVQGENSQKFQPRPDLLLWNWTDWSGGEGRRKQKFGESGRSWQLNGVRAFEEPGHLIPGYYVEITQDSTGTADFTKPVVFTVFANRLRAFESAAGNVYTWDSANSKWGIASANAAYDVYAPPVGSNKVGYWIDYNSQKTWKLEDFGISGLVGPTQVSTGTISSNPTSSLGESKDYLYVYDAIDSGTEESKLWEISKTSGTITLVENWNDGGVNVSSRVTMAILGDIVYLMRTSHEGTTIHSIVPTSAAGTGSVAEVANLPGFMGDSIWSHSGMLYLSGTSDNETANSILYYSPEGTYGSLGNIRRNDDVGNVVGGTSKMLDHFFVAGGLSTSQPNHALWQIDAISGGMACVAYDEVGDAAAEDVGHPIVYGEDVFWSTLRALGTDRVMRARTDRYMINSSAISPEHDFDLVGNKFLSSMALSCQPLIADWTLYVDYQINGNGTWTNAITYTTDGGTGTTAIVTTDTSTIEFKSLQMRIRFSYTGSGVPSTAPVVLGVEARAVVADKVKVINLLLDLSTSQSGGSQSRGGASKVDLIQATLAKKTAIDFKDGYTHRDSGEYDQYDVFVDSSKMVLSSPGEGVVSLKLREVV